MQAEAVERGDADAKDWHQPFPSKAYCPTCLDAQGKYQRDEVKSLLVRDYAFDAKGFAKGAATLGRAGTASLAPKLESKKASRGKSKTQAKPQAKVDLAIKKLLNDALDGPGRAADPADKQADAAAEQEALRDVAEEEEEEEDDDEEEEEEEEEDDEGKIKVSVSKSSNIQVSPSLSKSPSLQVSISKCCVY